MTVKELRQKFLEFFKERGHTIVPGAPLIPENDPTVLFTTAGMHPLVPYLEGVKHPEGTRLASVQKCIRTTDIEEVGDASHLTFFEMLGNWSLGDYGKREAIEMSFSFLTSSEWLNIPIKKLAITVFEGDEEVSRDDESAEIWKKLGVPEHKISFMGRADNWWGPAGETGPCGPDTEMFYYIGEGEPSQKSNPKTDSAKWVEIWNDVFMLYDKKAEGKYAELIQKNIDTGMGLERTSAVLQGKASVYEIELFTPLLAQIERLCGYKYEERPREFRIIADHARASAFILAEGVEPSNLDQGYVLRRLIRRAFRMGRQLGIEGSFLSRISEIVINQMRSDYPELQDNKSFIMSGISQEEEKFAKTLERGLREFGKMSSSGELSGKDAFVLFSTYGFPYEMTEELSKEKGIKIAKEEFDKEFKEHQEISRKGAEAKFKGGLADSDEETKKLHTATHLLQAALRKTLGEHVEQKGSNITAERLRFDFIHPDKLTEDEKIKVEYLVNDAIKMDYPITWEEIPTEEAKKSGALGFFGHKYGDNVKVYTVGKGDNIFSKEICGGPHIAHTGELGHFRIIKEEAISAGIRRIKAILESK
ncbi:MAG: alanine--tRNA ligase [Parcubacteria group bacterium CG10_big_fil_rev_8_21_14_0_10_36_14]|nr:MAG: alanine--tRNA ligase [Parcubacteria group bacterium CG10_big_fil_rev_8_21_14_0_10_36_14]